MKTSIATCAFMAASAAASPLVHNAHGHHHQAQKRGVEIVTVVDTVMKTQIAYATAYVYPNGQPVPSAAYVHAAAHTQHPAAPKVDPKPVQTSAPRPAKSAPVPSIPEASAQAPPVEASVPAPAPKAAAAAPEIKAAPKPAPAARPAPAPAPAPAAPARGPSAGKQYTGDMTFYTTGVGSCGWTNSDSEDVVAIPHGQMNNGANPNDNPLCGKTVTINYGGKTKAATIVDTCEGCADGALDMSDSLFEYFAPLSLGRAHGMKWSID